MRTIGAAVTVIEDAVEILLLVEPIRARVALDSPCARLS